jgi:hypothetical protein
MDLHRGRRYIGRRVRRISARLGATRRARHNARRGLDFGRSFAPTSSQADHRAPGTLERYFDDHREGPGLWKWRHYFDIYERHFARFVGEEVHLLEIGIFSGGSIDMWRRYFGEGLRFYGVDLEPACKAYEAPDAHVFIGDQADPSFWQRTLPQIPRLDIVVDDGGHRDFQQIATLEAVLPRLAPGGVYLCEDIHSIRHGFHDYISGMARNLHAVGPAAEDAPYRLVPTGFQRAVDSITMYPFVIVLERRRSDLEKLEAPKHGSQWQPFYEPTHTAPSSIRG